MFAKKLPYFVAPAVLGTALLTACSSDSNNSGPSVSRSEVKQNYVAMAAAAYTDSVTTAQTLKTAIDTFVADPTEQNLTAARAAYKEARVPYQQSEIMRWDETITTNHNPDQGGLQSIDDREGQVNAWPLDESLIEHIISQTSAIDAAALASQNGALTPSQQAQVDAEDDADAKQALIDGFGEANVTTGFHAIEFMLWNRDDQARGPGSRAASEFVCDSQAPQSQECRNAQYLSAAAELLVSDLQDMQAEWSNTENNTLAHNYLESAEGIDYMAQALASMAVGELAGARLAAGLWRDLRADGLGIKEGDYEEEHDCFSDLSHVAVYYNFVALKNAFYGSYTKLDGSVVSGPSFGGYLNSLNSSLYNQLDTVLKAADVQMQIVYDAGERAENPKSFDDIIADSEAYYDAVANNVTPLPAKSAELIAIETAISELAKVENIIIDVKDALELVAVDPDNIGETD